MSGTTSCSSMSGSTRAATRIRNSSSDRRDLPAASLDRKRGTAAHGFIDDSVSGDVGQTVPTGEVVGRCGNSGHSLEPHLHLQVQDRPTSTNQHQETGTRD